MEQGKGKERSRIVITGSRARNRYIQTDHHPYLMGGYNSAAASVSIYPRVPFLCFVEVPDTTGVDS